MTMMSDDSTIAALGTARTAAREAVAAGKPGGLLDPRRAVDDYRAALADCPLGRDALVTARGDLERRLLKGLTLPGNDQAVGDLFGALLSRHEACEDLLDAAGARRRFADWELRIADAQLAARASGRGA